MVDVARQVLVFIAYVGSASVAAIVAAYGLYRLCRWVRD